MRKTIITTYYIMDKTKAYSPACLSFIFRKIKGKNLLTTGSLGVGCTIDKGVMAEAEKSSQPKIFLNGKRIKLPTVEYACKQMIDRKIIIHLHSPLPLGCGFGISGASTLAALFAVNRLFALRKSRKTLIEIAHRAEIINHTGLGGVGTQSRGGFIIKKTAGIPFAAKILPFSGKKIYAVVIGALETPIVLKDNKRVEKINKIADYILSEISNREKPTLEEIISLSHEFARESGLIADKKVISIIKKVQSLGGYATMSMLGNVVISTTKVKIPGYPTYSLTVSEDRTKNL